MVENNCLGILIIGEFSGLAKNLKNGFFELGHKVIIVSSGDGFKKIETDYDDIKYSNKRLKLFGKYIPKSRLLFAPIENRKIQRKLNLISMPIDILIVINYSFITNSIFKVGVNIKYINKLVFSSSKLIVSCCGGDPANRKYYSELKYWKEKFPNGIIQPTKNQIKIFNKLILLSNIIIPISYTYYYSISKYSSNNNLKLNISNIIPVPIKIGEFIYSSCSKRKIVIFHGVIREQDKGTMYFISALNKIKKEFKDEVEIIIEGKIPYNDYIKLLDRIDILLDQTNGYGISMNAALGLMKGKVVLGGNEEENEEKMGLGKVPIINVIPDSDYIYNVLKDLILYPEKIDRIKLESRKFAVENLNAKVVAKRYLVLLK